MLTAPPHQALPSQPQHLTHPKYRPDIDGLRAIAILAVVGFHAFPSRVKAGFTGVDIFFVISGFLITTIILESLQRNSFSFVEFYSRRVKRIFPALILVLLATFAFGWFVLLPDEYMQLGRHIAAGAGFVSNFAIWNESGYFDNAAETKPLLHLWSLGIEEQFYLIWPLLLWAAWKRRFNLLFITMAIGIVSLALNIGDSNRDPVTAFYSPLTRFWELSIGSSLAYFTVFKQSTPRAPYMGSDNLRSFFGAMLVAVGMLLITKERTFPGWWALLPTLGTALLISASSKAWLNRAVLSNRVLVWFGLISYPLYLWHWPLLSFARIVESQEPSFEIRIVALSVSIALASFTYNLIEKPIRFRNSGSMRIAALIIAMALVGSAGYSSFTNGGYRYRQSLQHRLTERVTEQFMDPIWKYAQNHICLTQYPFKESRDYPYWFCMKSKDTEPTLLILGNSFANQLYPGFALNDRLKHHTVLSIGACDPARLQESDIKDEPLLSVCAGYRAFHQQQLIDDIIRKSGTVKYVILDGLGAADSKYASRFKDRIDFFEMHGIRVIAFTPHFRPGYHPKACFARPLKTLARDCSFDAQMVKTIYNNFTPLMDAISKTNPNVLFFDQNILFCPSQKCSILRDGMPLHRDENHISEFGSIELAHQFTEWAQLHVPEILKSP